MSAITKHETGAVLFTTNMQSLSDFYERVAEMTLLLTADDHIRLEKGLFRLTVHQIPEPYAKNITITTPPTIRENSAVKLVFQVEDLAKARHVATEMGGAVDPPQREWDYEGTTVCDGYDPD